MSNWILSRSWLSTPRLSHRASVVLRPNWKNRLMRIGTALAAVVICLLPACWAADPATPKADKPPAETSGDAAQKKAAPPASKNRSQAEESDMTDPDKEKAEKSGLEHPFPKRFPAASLDGGASWLNVSGPITLKDLRGKVVLLDFWTYCCINCMHVLPDLKYLEQKYDKELVVIGVHSAKFDNEKDTESIRRAIMRYEIEHPVINDNEMTVWRKFRVHAWPTVVLIDAEGNYCGYLSGEGNREILDEVIGRLVAYHKAKGNLDETPIKFALEREKAQPGPLAFPGKVLVDEPGGRIFISDSNHNRIVISSLEGKLQATVGTGKIGRDDGSYEKATFDHPQGMALVGQTLYVADTENHMIRAIDLEKKTVSTVAGTGQQGHPRSVGGTALKTEIGSPWDLVWADDKLFIAMAGPHQIWVLDPDQKQIRPYAGSSREDILNGPLKEAALAQPSGITTDGKNLYVVDSEGSAVRQIPVDPSGQVTTLAGTSDLPNGRCLFEFGDQDGTGDEARLQHPLGIVYHDGLLYVADSYNHKIRTVDPKSREVKTLLGDGRPGADEKPVRFSEPAGLAILKGQLLVADTNNHQLRLVDLATKATRVFPIAGLQAPVIAQAATPSIPKGLTPIQVPAQQLAAGEKLRFSLKLQLPEAYKLNPLAPPTFRLSADGEQTLLAADLLGVRQEAELPGPDAPLVLELPAAKGAGKGKLNLIVTYNYCREGEGGLCKIGTTVWSIPIERSDAGTVKEIPLTLKVEK